MTPRVPSRYRAAVAQSKCRTDWWRSLERDNVMPQILTTNAVVLCPHGGKGTTHPSSRKWKISGGYVAVEGDTGDIACPFLPCPCYQYTLRSMNLNATKLDGKRVILVTDFNESVTG